MFVSAFGPHCEMDEENRETFWNDDESWPTFGASTILNQHNYFLPYYRDSNHQKILPKDPALHKLKTGKE